METEKPKIALYVKRSFGEKFNASFDFIKENWKLMLKYATYLLLPLCLGIKFEWTDDLYVRHVWFSGEWIS